MGWKQPRENNLVKMNADPSMSQEDLAAVSDSTDNEPVENSELGDRNSRRCSPDSDEHDFYVNLSKRIFVTLTATASRSIKNKRHSEFLSAAWLNLQIFNCWNF